MAGLGEACSHIAAILYLLETLSRMQETRTCTQEECQWVIPSYLKTAEYLPIKEIDFTSARGKKRKLDDMIDGKETQQKADPKVVVTGKRSTESELALLYEGLSCGGTKPGVLSLIPKHSDMYVPKSLCDGFPKPLCSLKQPCYTQMSYPELLAECECISLDISKEMAEKVKKATRSQSNSKLWFTYRAGRITASRMKAVCRTDSSNPSQSLIKTICYPEAFKFVTAATKWGCKHEKEAKELYFRANKEKHSDFSIAESGLVINPMWPHIGASPDGIISCTCHGVGVLEIKCPYCHRGTDIESAADNPNFCLVKIDGKLHLDNTHAYYYQVQCQLYVCDVAYGDFCVCTFEKDEGHNSYSESGMHIERIYKDSVVWDECTLASERFFKTCLLPEIIGNWYTRPAVTTERNVIDTTISTDVIASSSLNSSATLEDSADLAQDQPTYCYCHKPEKETMIACDNPDCPYEWFHISCLKMTTIPKGKWYCPDCRKLPKFIRKNSRTAKK